MLVSSTPWGSLGITLCLIKWILTARDWVTRALMHIKGKLLWTLNKAHVQTGSPIKPSLLKCRKAPVVMIPLLDWIKFWALLLSHRSENPIISLLKSLKFIILTLKNRTWEKNNYITMKPRVRNLKPSKISSLIYN